MQNKTKGAKLGGIFLFNITLVQGVLLAPIVVAATTFFNALAISIVFALLTFFSILISSFISKQWPYVLRLVVNVILASIVFIPSAMLVEWILPGSQERLGIYLPLLITNSMIMQIGSTNLPSEKKGTLIKNVGTRILGFSWVICLVGVIREFLAAGKIFGIPLTVSWLPAALYPFTGFILLGFLAALIKLFRSMRGYKEEL